MLRSDLTAVIVEQYKQGTSQQALAKRYNCSIHTIHRRLASEDITIRNRRPEPCDTDRGRHHLESQLRLAREELNSLHHEVARFRAQKQDEVNNILERNADLRRQLEQAYEKIHALRLELSTRKALSQSSGGPRIGT